MQRVNGDYQEFLLQNYLDLSIDNVPHTIYFTFLAHTNRTALTNTYTIYKYVHILIYKCVQVLIDININIYLYLYIVYEPCCTYSYKSGSFLSPASS